MPSLLYEQFQPQNPLISMAQQFKQNPLGMLAQRYKFPQFVIIGEGQVASAACLSLYLRR